MLFRLIDMEILIGSGSGSGSGRGLVGFMGIKTSLRLCFCFGGR